MKKKVVRKIGTKKATKKSVKTAKPLRVTQPKPIGVVTHFYGNIKVGIVKFNKPIKVGTTVIFRGVSTDFSQEIKSMQFDHAPIQIAKKGKQVGMKVSKRVREGDEVFLAD